MRTSIDDTVLNEQDCVSLRLLVDERLAPNEERNPHTIRRILQKVEFNLSRERSRAICGHHNYDLNKHIALLETHKSLRRLVTDKKKGGL